MNLMGLATPARCFFSGRIRTSYFVLEFKLTSSYDLKHEIRSLLSEMQTYRYE